MQNTDIIYCYECKHCFKNKRSKTGYSCEMWGYDDFADDVSLDGYCYKAKVDMALRSLVGWRTFKSESLANDTLEKLKAVAYTYGCVTVCDYLDILGASNMATYLDTKYGWRYSALDKCAEIIETPFGYFLKLPTPFPIE